jgi:hypothetical protein
MKQSYMPTTDRILDRLLDSDCRFLYERIEMIQFETSILVCNRKSGVPELSQRFSGNGLAQATCTSTAYGTHAMQGPTLVLKPLSQISSSYQLQSLRIQTL